MHIIHLIFGILLLLLSINNFWQAAKTWPEKTYWKDLSSGRYETTKDYANDRIIMKDTYGNIKVVFKRDKTLEK